MKSVEVDLDLFTSALKRKDISDQQLTDMHQQLNPPSTETQQIINALTTDLAAAKTRLDQLGPKPKDGAPAEAAAVASQRQALTEAFNNIDSLLKRAKVVKVRFDQLASDITARRRALLQQTLLRQSRSVLHPLFWYEAALETPAAATAMVSVAADWLNYASSQIHKTGTVKFIGFLAVLIVLFSSLYYASRRMLPRNRAKENPDEFDKILGAVWVALVVFAIPSAAAWALIELLRYFDAVSTRIQPLLAILMMSVQRIALTAGLARGILAPDKPAWRVVNIDDPRARILSRLAFRIICIIAVMHIAEALFGITAAPLILSHLTLAIGTLAITLLIARTLYGAAEYEAHYDDELGPVVAKRSSLLGLWRILIWLSVLVIIAANLFGYFNLAEFTMGEIVRVTFVLVVSFIIIRLAETGIPAAFRSGSFAGRLAASTFGVHPHTLEQSAIVLIGAIKLIVFVTVAVILLAPFGIQGTSLLDTLTAVFYGFEIGGVRISLSTIVIAIGLLIAGFFAARAFQNWLEDRYLPSTNLEPGLRNSIATSTGYIGIVAAIAIALGYMGLSFDKLALVAGALSLGIGFGLQSIVNNFVSGLILLWERSIKIGDWIVVGTDEGYVRKINVRSTEIETFNNQTVIIPNSNLISGVVKNWVKNDTTGRIIVPVGVSYGADPEQVSDILLACAATHELIMEKPTPKVIFANFGDSSLDFELRCYLTDVGQSLTVSSHLRFEIFKRLKEAGIEIPFPQRDLNLRDFDKIAELVKSDRNKV